MSKPLPHFPWPEYIAEIITPHLNGAARPLQQAILRLLSAPSKLLRPKLVMALAADAQANGPEFKHFAIALELIHGYTLIHDDLPCMDNAQTRRGLPACHLEFGEANAVLAGDGLHSLALQIISATPQPKCGAATLLNVINRMMHYCGTQGLLAGQVADLNPPHLPTPEVILTTYRQKTSALFALATEGTILMTPYAEQATALAEALNQWGLAFQLYDDLADQMADSYRGATNYANFSGNQPHVTWLHIV